MIEHLEFKRFSQINDVALNKPLDSVTHSKHAKTLGMSRANNACERRINRGGWSARLSDQDCADCVLGCCMHEHLGFLSVDVSSITVTGDCDICEASRVKGAFS